MEGEAGKNAGFDVEARLTDPLNQLHIPNTRANVALAYNYVLDAMDGRYVTHLSFHDVKT
jgi:hypothetical protein